jgi:NAD kinase
MRGNEPKIVIVTRPTQLQGLVARHATPQQARFQLVRSRVAAATAGAPQRASTQALAAQAKEDQAIARDAESDFDLLAAEDAGYASTVANLRGTLSDFAPVQCLDRQYLPNYVFGPEDVVVTVGQDGLVANTAKYALNRPIVAVNPDPTHIDGILLPFTVRDAVDAVRQCMRGQAKTRRVTLGEVNLVDGQRLLAFNDFFIGARTHISARYSIEFAGKREQQSSSGVIVSTGAGSTGWLSSILNMLSVTSTLTGEPVKKPATLRLNWDDPRLVFVTREPFLSKTSGIDLSKGIIAGGHELTIESRMPREGVIFSDGVEADFLEFNSGAIARIRAAKEQALLVSK